jgi:hypothetical protein
MYSSISPIQEAHDDEVAGAWISVDDTHRAGTNWALSIPAVSQLSLQKSSEFGGTAYCVRGNHDIRFGSNAGVTGWLCKPTCETYFK